MQPASADGKTEPWSAERLQLYEARTLRLCVYLWVFVCPVWSQLTLHCRNVWMDISKRPNTVRPSSDRQSRPDWRRPETEQQFSSTPSGNMTSSRSSRKTEKTSLYVFSSCRLFSEGGDFSPEEVAMFLKSLRKETKQIFVTQMSIYSELETFECQNLQQVCHLCHCPYKSHQHLTVERKESRSVSVVFSVNLWTMLSAEAISG